MKGLYRWVTHNPLPLATVGFAMAEDEFSGGPGGRHEPALLRFVGEGAATRCQAWVEGAQILLSQIPSRGAAFSTPPPQNTTIRIRARLWLAVP